MAPRSKKIRAPSDIFFGHNKSRECGPKIRNFRANGIPVGERGDFFDTHTKELLLCGLCSSAVFFFLHFCKALAAIYRAVIPRDERHFGNAAAGSTYCIMHFSGSSAGILTLIAAGLAALRFVYKAFGFVKLLFPCSKYEFLTAILAN